MALTRVTNGMVSGIDPNFIINGNAELDTSGWATYADGAVTAPVDGTGGTVTGVTFTRSTTSPLIDSASFLLSRTAAAQGQGASYAFAIPDSMKAKVLQISFDYRAISGTFAAGSTTTDSDMVVYLVDVTNGTVIQPSTYRLYGSSASLATTFVGNFQTASNSSSYRLCFHIPNTTSTAFGLQIDSIVVCPSSYVYGTPITDWQSYTPTGSWTGTTTYTGKWRRVGDSLEVDIGLTLSGAATAANLTVNYLPPGLTVDSSKLSLFGNFTTFGTADGLDFSAGTAYSFIPIYNSASSVLITYQSQLTAAEAVVNATAPFTFAASDNVHVRLSVPITGWSATAQQSDSADSRVVAYIGNGSTTNVSCTAGGAYTQLTFPVTGTDTHGAVLTSIFTAPVSGIYDILGLINTGASTGTKAAAIYKNGVVNGPEYPAAGTGAFSTIWITGTYDLKAGDTIKVYAHNTATTESWNIGSLSIKRTAQASLMSATETVAFSASKNTGSLANSANTIVSSWTQVNLNTHGTSAFDPTTGVFTAPCSGTYVFNGSVAFASGVVSGFANFVIDADTSSAGKSFNLNGNSTASATCFSGTTPPIRLRAGQTVAIYAFQGSGGTLNYATNAAMNPVYFGGYRVGN
jgi:hypothetical protein